MGLGLGLGLGLGSGSGLTHMVLAVGHRAANQHALVQRKPNLNPNPWIHLAKKKGMFLILTWVGDRSEGVPWRPWQLCGPL